MRCLPSCHRSPMTLTADSGTYGKRSSGSAWGTVLRPSMRRSISRNLEANCLQIKIEFQFGEELELLSEHALIPGGVLGQAIVGDQESRALRLGEMAQLDSRYRLPSHLARRQE